MPEPKTRNEIETLQGLIERAQQPQKAGDYAKPFVIVPEGCDLKIVDETLARPTRKKGVATFTRAGSFCIYVNEQKDESSRLYVISPVQIVCVLNHHTAGTEAGWGDHRAAYNLTKTLEWMAWTGSNLQQKTQRDFAQFIEDNAENITSPKGAELLDMIRTIKASHNLEITGEVNELNDPTAGGFVIQAKTKAGVKQDVELPAEFTISVAPYEGSEEVPLRARLRLQLNGKATASFWF